MEMPKEITETIQKQINERLSSPLIFSFLISWSVINWEFFVIVLSAADIKQTFKLVADTCFPTWWEGILYGYILPLISALIYVVCYPFVNKRLVLWGAKINSKLQDGLHEIHKTTVLPEDDAKILRAQVSLEKSKYYAQLEDEKRKFNIKLAESVSSRQEELGKNQELLKELEQIKREKRECDLFICQLQATILNFENIEFDISKSNLTSKLSQQERGMLTNYLYSILKVPENSILMRMHASVVDINKDAIKKLIEHGFVTLEVDTSGQNNYYPTEAGLCFQELMKITEAT